MRIPRVTAMQVSVLPPPRVWERLEAYTLRGVLHVPRTAEPCWLWTGPVNGAGYGELAWHQDVAGQRVYVHAHAHWLAYARARLGGRTPAIPGAIISHRCDVRLCVNPRHLYLGNRHSNARDVVVRGRSAYDGVARAVRNTFRAAVARAAERGRL